MLQEQLVVRLREDFLLKERNPARGVSESDWVPGRASLPSALGVRARRARPLANTAVTPPCQPFEEGPRDKLMEASLALLFLLTF